jgi:hypothetical protein
VELGCHGFDKLTMTNPQYVVHCHPELVEGCAFFMSWPRFTEWLPSQFVHCGKSWPASQEVCQELLEKLFHPESFWDLQIE